MNPSGQELDEEAVRRGGGLRGDVAGRDAAQVREELADHRNIGGLGENLAVVANQVGFCALGEGGGQVGGVGFEQEMAGGDAGGVFAGAGVLGTGEGAAERDMDVFCGEGGESVGGAGVGVDEESGGVRGQGQEDLEHGVPRIAAVEAGGQGPFIGEVELGAEDGFAVGVEVVAHAGVEADFADAGGAGGQGGAEVVQPAGAAVADEPGVEAEGAEQAGVGVGEGADGGPVGLGGGIDVEKRHAGGAGAGEDAGQMGGQARILQVGVGVDPGEILTVGRHGGCYAVG